MATDNCKCEECEEWPLSMADMMTNLLCFFVLLVSIASFDEAKYQAISEAMLEGMGGENADAVMSADMQAEFELQQTIQIIMQDLKTLFDAEDEDIELEYRKNAVAINLIGSEFFKPGSAEFADNAADILDRVASIMGPMPFPVAVEGHTDSIPINSSDYPSNWELSGQRAAAVARYFLDKGLSKELLKVVGRSDTHPIASNETTAGRALNRRIVILISPM